MTDSKPSEVTFHSYPKLVFCWPIIAIGFALWFFGGGEDPPVEPLAWIWGITISITILTMGVDLNRNVTVFWGVLILCLWLGISYLGTKGFTFFVTIYGFFADLDPAYSRNLGLIVSIMLLIPYLVMLVWSRLNSRWRVTHNEFEHYSFGRADDALARGAKRVRTEYPDFLEFMVLLAGDLVVFDSLGQRELRRIRHIPLLPFIRKKINRILETTSVTTTDMHEDEEASQAANESDDRAL